MKTDNHRAGAYCPYCGSEKIGVSPLGENGIVVVCDECKEPIWSPENGMYIEYWAIPIPNYRGRITVPSNKEEEK